MSNVRSYKDLVDEKKKLELTLALQRDIIRQDFKGIREDAKPALQLISTVAKITSRSLRNPLVSFGVNLAGDLFIKNKILAGAAPFLFKSIASFFRNGRKQ